MSGMGPYCFPFTALDFTALDFTAPDFTALDFTALDFTALHSTGITLRPFSASRRRLGTAVAALIANDGIRRQLLCYSK